MARASGHRRTRLRHHRRAVPLALAGCLLAATGCGGGLGGAGAESARVTGSPAAAAAAADGSDAAQLPPDVAAALDRAVTGVQRQAQVPGVLVGLWLPGRGSYVKAFGTADRSTGSPMTTGLYMRIGSETKTFTVTALLELVDQGRVRLDDPVSAYVRGVPGGERVTLRQLAGMRSGLFSYTDDPGFVRALVSNPGRSFTPRELLGYAFRHRAQFAPGARFQYSNTNTILLGLVVERVTGRPLGEVLRQRVLAPLGLGHTLLPLAAEFPAPHAHGYTNQTPTGAVADATGWNASWAWAAGAMISDLGDLRVWARAVATGTLLTRATQGQRLAFASTGLAETGYGLGIFTNHGWVGHNGSLPGYQSLVLYLPSQRATLVVLANTDVSHQGSEPSTLFGEAVTRVVSPGNVYSFPPSPVAAPTPVGR